MPTGSYGVVAQDTRFDPATDHRRRHGVNVGYTGNLKDGDEVRYDNGGGTSVNPLVDGNLYYVKVIDGQHVKLYADHALSGSPISLSGGSGENQRLVPTNQAGVTKDTSNRFNPHSADVDYGTSTIHLPYALDFVEQRPGRLQRRRRHAHRRPRRRRRVLRRERRRGLHELPRALDEEAGGRRDEGHR